MRRLCVTAAMLPLFVFAVLLLVGAAQLEKDLLRQRLHGEMRTAAAAVQQSLTEETAFLAGVALAQSSQAEDLQRLRKTAELAQHLHPSVATITLHDRRHALFDLRVAPDQAVPAPEDEDSLDAVWATGQPGIGRWIDGKVALRLPLREDGKVRFVLSALLDTRRFSDLLHAEVSPRRWVAALIDRNLTIIARSDHADQFVGGRPTPAIVEAIRRGRTGVERAVTKDGAVSYGAVIPLAATGWYLAMAIPDAVAAQTYRSVRLMLLGAGGLALLCGGLIYAVLAWRNVRRLERRTDVLSTELVDANRRSGEASAFLAMMTHELRTPLTAVLGFTDLLAKSPLDPAQAEWVEHQRGAGRALLAIINDILDCSKIEAGAVRLESIAFNLPALAKDAVTLVQPAADAKGLHLALDCPPEVPVWLQGDPTRLQQVIGNLLGNAVKFTAAGAVCLSLRPALSPAGSPVLRVAVRDTGIGIPAGKRDRLFRRFSQVDASTNREYGGTGLGLAICKSLVGLMGGTIGVDSAEGQGSTFWFTVPLLLAEAPAASGDPRRPIPKPSGGHGCILLVEDNPVTQLLTRTVLEQAGHQVAVAGNGADAVEAVRCQRFDLVLMDVHLPRLDGPGAARAIRKLDGARGRLPIIALTADATAEDAEICRSSGMDGHLTKPFRPADLLATVDACLGQCLEVEPRPAAPSLDADMQAAMLSAIGEDNMAALEAAFLERADLAKRELRAARADTGQLIETAHPLIGAAGMLGYRGVEEAARALCRACRSGDQEQIACRFAALLKELNAVCQDPAPKVPEHSP